MIEAGRMKNGIRGIFTALLAGLALAACATVPGSKRDYKAAEAALSMHIRTLASEAYGGRKPGTEGGAKTEQYLVDALTGYGFQPGAAEGQWRQPVKLVRSLPGEAMIDFRTGKTISGEEVIARIPGENIALEESRVTVFAPGAQQLPAGSQKGRSAVLFQEALFAGEGQAMAEAGFDAIYVLFEDEEMFERAAGFFRNGRWSLQGTAPVSDTPYVLLSPDASIEFAGAIGNSISDLRELSGKQEGGEFQRRNPVWLSATARVEAVETANVIGKLPGKVHDSGAVMILAHWDHLGTCGPQDAPDRLCNGAVDNASGIGVMLEVARRIAAQGGLDRDFYVMGTTAEEIGLLGAEAFAADPPFPLPTIVAAFNMDTVAIAPKGSPVTVVGWGRTPLDEGIRKVVEGMGTRFMVVESTEQFVRRQDGWALLSRDVPTVLVSTSFGDEEKFNAFLDGPYHRADDEWSEDMELGGATDDIFIHVALLRHFGSVAEYQPGMMEKVEASAQ
ncbi:M28 family peptidase [Erythrobacter sp. SDW2]|uniref:M28 family peptidase n=1 Tax=Erythrobacter sp. SDW2 TaxID=2907154 RepID=UPI001F453323|nr:M28 family peptidase [Erythrobacter sp. SDW2]UIP05603.1 M28 family peptidase [Erythrobacter sp. SDW2]